ncbi:MAG: hypothetical protein QMC96_06455 [Methanomicrobiales archaeon]|nr:hypothetical protein [Methanomicrobiales archaeon]
MADALHRLGHAEGMRTSAMQGKAMELAWQMVFDPEKGSWISAIARLPSHRTDRIAVVTCFHLQQCDHLFTGNR